ncbi:hypothetical protein HDE_09560 [Halotydeus destructor]|nr:hypothetical protein HDE_09560 [Halotydeus destructor]
MMAYIKRTPLRLAIRLDDSPFISGAASLKFYSHIYKRANLTFQPLAAAGVGYRTPQGNYTDFLGQLVENRSDVAMYATALKSLPFPNIVPGPVVSSLSLKIHSKMAEAKKEPIDVLSSIQSLPLEFTVLVIASVHTVACCTFVTSTTSARGYFEGWWTSLRCFVDQEDWNVEQSSKRIVWLFFNGFVLVAVFGYTLNLMSTDAFVMKQPRRIDTLDDVFDSFFADVHFYLSKTSFFFNFVRESKKNTIMGKLYEKMKNQSDCSRALTCSFSEMDGKLGSASQQESFQVFQNLTQQGGGASFMSDEIRQELVVPAICRLQPDMLTKMYTGLSVLAEDILVYLVRADMDRQVDAYLRYFPTSLYEFHLLRKATAEDLHNAIDTIRPEGRDLAYQICISQGAKEVLGVDINVGLEAYKRLFTIWVYIASLAGIILVFELVVFFRKSMRRRRLGRRSMRNGCSIKVKKPADVNLAEGKRLSDRFDKIRIITTPFRISLPVSSDKSIYTQAMLDSMTPILKHTNCTLKPIKSYGIGYRTPRGNHTAFLGSLLENRSDFAFYGTPLSSFNYDSLVPGPVLSSLSFGIYSQAGTNDVVPGDALDTVTGLPVEVKLYLAVVVHLIACCMAHAKKNFLSSYLVTTWHSMLTFVDQENHAVNSKTRRIIWLSFNVFTFVSVFGFILNLMSTDAFVVSQPRRIETVDDVFDSYFIDRNIRYYLTTNDFFFNYVRDSQPGTAMSKLYKHLNSTNDCSELETCSLLDIDTGNKDSFSKQQKLIALIQSKLEKDDSALFVTKQLADHCVIPATCRMKPDWMTKLFVSPHSVAADTMITVERADLDRDIRRYLRYKFASFFEFGRFWLYVEEFVHGAADTYSQGKDLKYYQCMNRENEPDQDVLLQVKPETYVGLTGFVAYILVLAMFALLAELIMEQLTIAGRQQECRLFLVQPRI